MAREYGKPRTPPFAGFRRKKDAGGATLGSHSVFAEGSMATIKSGPYAGKRVRVRGAVRGTESISVHLPGVGKYTIAAEHLSRAGATERIRVRRSEAGDYLVQAEGGGDAPRLMSYGHESREAAQRAAKDHSKGGGVKSYRRRTKSGKIITVRAYTRTIKVRRRSARSEWRYAPPGAEREMF